MDISEIKKICLDEFEKNADYINQRAKINIEKYRKGDCKIKIIDKSGNPLKNTIVKIKQTNHDFKYGANIFMLDEFESSEDNKKYRDTFYEFFNLATVPFYWEAIEPTEGHLRYEKDSDKIHRRPAPDLCFEYCEEKGILPKLHCLVYDTTRPNWVNGDDVEKQLKLYEKRFKEIADRYGNRMYEVEVINELLSAAWRPELVSKLSAKRDILEWCFGLARQYFPNQTLVINDGDYFRTTDTENYRNKYFMMVDHQLAKGTPIDKIGFQHHLFIGTRNPWEEDLPNKAELYDPMPTIRGLDMFNELGIPMEITEITYPTFGTSTEAEEIQAEVLKWYYTIYFSTPNMESAVYWNTVEGTAHTIENRMNGGLFHKDLTPKLSAIMLKKLFTEVWHTDLELSTDENGCIDFRGFYGDYIGEVAGKEFIFGLHKNVDIENPITI